MTETTNQGQWKTFPDQIEIAGHKLIEAVTGLVSEGNVRTLRIHTEAGPVFMEIPLTAGAITGVVVVLTAPWLAAIGAIAGLAAKVRIEIVRESDLVANTSGSPVPDAPSVPN